jgi:hypothetical protein
VKKTQGVLSALKHKANQNDQWAPEPADAAEQTLVDKGYFQ